MILVRKRAWHSLVLGLTSFRRKVELRPRSVDLGLEANTGHSVSLANRLMSACRGEGP